MFETAVSSSADTDAGRDKEVAGLVGEESPQVKESPSQLKLIPKAGCLARILAIEWISSL